MAHQEQEQNVEMFGITATVLMVVAGLVVGISPMLVQVILLLS
ncbi:hypothetical protein Q4508_05260 [Amphritea sp. 2_MG-2023]|jgi:hypothetical protein|nr:MULTISPECIES: hypothetical protein [Amphritea]MDO6417961.1 hypothetical protein [Amphritea sp. 2_MG-2023]